MSNQYKNTQAVENSEVDRQVESGQISSKKTIRIQFNENERKYYESITIVVGTEGSDINYRILLDEHQNINAETNPVDRTISNGESEAVTVEHQVKNLIVEVNPQSQTDFEVVATGRR